MEETGVPGENHRPDADVIFTKFSKHRRKIQVSILLKKLKKKKKKKTRTWEQEAVGDILGDNK